MTFDELMAGIRSVRPLGPVVTYVDVSPDVWEDLRVAVPICRGNSLSTPHIHIRIDRSLPPRTMVPLDQDGLPMPKPPWHT